MDSGTSEVEELFRDHYLGLVRLATLLVGDVVDAEDVVQEVFVELQGGPGLLHRNAGYSYLRTAVINRTRARLRRVRTVRQFLRGQNMADFGGHAPHARLAEHRDVLDALRRITTRQREVLVLRFWLDLSEADIAASLGISRGSVKSTASKGIRALERILEVGS